MAKQADGSETKKVQTTATGNAADTGTPVSLPPTKPPRVRFSDDFGGKGDLNYGRNRQNLPSSLNPGESVQSDLARDMESTVGDPVLDQLKRTGSASMRANVGDDVENVRGTPASQIRSIGAKNVPVHPAMKDGPGVSNERRQPSYPGPNSVIPAELADDEKGPVRQPQ